MTTCFFKNKFEILHFKLNDTYITFKDIQKGIANFFCKQFKNKMHFSPGLFSIHIGIVNTAPKDTRPKDEVVT